MAHEINRSPKAVILAAGLGTRLCPQTDGCHKSLLPVGGSTILERLIRNCLSCGIRNSFWCWHCQSKLA